MSISDKLTTIRNTLKAIKEAIINKGQTPSGDITTYSDAINNISGGEAVQYIPREVINGALAMPKNSFAFSLPNDITAIGDYTMCYALYNSNINSVDLSNVTIIGKYGLYSAFGNNSLISTVNLSNITDVGNFGMFEAFKSCVGFISVDLSKLTTIGASGLQGAFRNCSSLRSVDFSSLTNIGSVGLNNAFIGCVIEEINFPALTSTSFGSNTNQFNNMLTGVFGCTVHFPSNLESVIGSWATASAMGQTMPGSITVKFDLPATS